MGAGGGDNIYIYTFATRIQNRFDVVIVLFRMDIELQYHLICARDAGQMAHNSLSIRCSQYTCPSNLTTVDGALIKVCTCTLCSLVPLEWELNRRSNDNTRNVMRRKREKKSGATAIVVTSEQSAYCVCDALAAAWLTYNVCDPAVSHRWLVQMQKKYKMEFSRNRSGGSFSVEWRNILFILPLSLTCDVCWRRNIVIAHFRRRNRFYGRLSIYVCVSNGRWTIFFHRIASGMKWNGTRDRFDRSCPPDISHSFLWS